ncbi:MAG: di-trans,poly-cis-decaprenylcistransferase [Actinobacteria bacterium]|jgi:undecaprenyl diphosphate synthase|nr:di-trans,poly-cis-decaprenylcistransferase [Actinomycetota bacterium]
MGEVAVQVSSRFDHDFILSLPCATLGQPEVVSVRVMNAKPLHIACIMDGNGRWAKKRGLPRTAGHSAGEESLADVVRAAAKREVDYLTVFGFSTENWVRPRAEVRHILGLHKKLFGRIEELNENNVRVNWIGRPFDEPGTRTPLYVQRAIRKAIEDTKNNTGMVLTVAFDYGSRSELTRAAIQLVKSGAEVKPENLQKHLYDSSLPPVDVLVRTSGESRISNFLLWQIKSAKIYFTERPWPDFDAIELDAAIALTKN